MNETETGVSSLHVFIHFIVLIHYSLGVETKGLGGLSARLCNEGIATPIWVTSDYRACVQIRMKI